MKHGLEIHITRHRCYLLLNLLIGRLEHIAFVQAF